MTQEEYENEIIKIKTEHAKETTELMNKINDQKKEHAQEIVELMKTVRLNLERNNIEIEDYQNAKRSYSKREYELKSQIEEKKDIIKKLKLTDKTLSANLATHCGIVDSYLYKILKKIPMPELESQVIVMHYYLGMGFDDILTAIPAVKNRVNYNDILKSAINKLILFIATKYGE